MDTFLDVTGIVKRAKQVLNFKNDSELAEYLGVSRAPQLDTVARETPKYSAETLRKRTGKRRKIGRAHV